MRGGSSTIILSYKNKDIYNCGNYGGKSCYEALGEREEDKERRRINLEGLFNKGLWRFIRSLRRIYGALSKKKGSTLCIDLEKAYDSP